MSSPFDNERLVDTLEERVAGLEFVLHDVMNEQFMSAPTCDRDAHGAPREVRAPIFPEPMKRPRQGAISDLREKLITHGERKWVNGVRLRYFLFDRAPYKGSASNVDMVRKAFRIWDDLGLGIAFEEVDCMSEAELRIAFAPDGRSWSYIGTDCLHMPMQSEPTMNFGWELGRDPKGLDAALQQVGRALGLAQEHADPLADMMRQSDSVVTDFTGDTSRIRSRRLDEVFGGFAPVAGMDMDWDPAQDSPTGDGGPALIRFPAQPRRIAPQKPAPQGRLGQWEREEALKFYPPLKDQDLVELTPFQSDVLRLEPCEQQTYLLRPDATRDYHIQAIGAADMVLVLFRQEGDRRVYVAGSNDAGSDANAMIDTRLERGGEYVLCARMISNFDRDCAGVIYW